MPQQHSVYAVFTPATQARVNLVERPAVNDRLVQALRTPGTQLVVFGESGSGKSTLIQAKLRELYTGHVTSRCTSATTFAGLLLDGFDQLAPFYADVSGATDTRGRTATLSADFQAVRAGVALSRSTATSEQSRRALPPQLTPQRLAEFMGARGLCWVIEDFHKVAVDEKTAVAQTFKVFSDAAAEFEAVKIIAVGATESAREVVQYDSEVRHRVAEILVPLMTADEIEGIVDNGERLLNVDMSSMKSNIVLYSIGVPAVAHQLSLNACVSRGVEVTQTGTVTMSGSDFNTAVRMWLEDSSDSLKAAFDKALMRHRIRQYDNCQLILTALADGPLTGLLHAEILEKIHQSEPSYPASNLTLYLSQLTTEERGEILLKAPDGRYRFSDPLHHTYAKARLLEPESATTDQSLYSYLISTLGTVAFDFNASTDWISRRLSPSVYYMSWDTMQGSVETIGRAEARDVRASGRDDHT